MNHYYDCVWHRSSILRLSLIAVFFFWGSLGLSAENCPYQVTDVITNTICAGATNGGIDLTVTNCNAPTYVWSTGANTEDLQGIAAGNYSVTVTDAYGCITIQSYTVQQLDNIAPIAICKDVVIQLGNAGTVTITPSYVDNGSYDNCGIASMTINPTSFTCADVGSQTVTLTVTDVNGNVSTCQSTVFVKDFIAPIAICKNTTIYLDATGNATLTFNDIDNGSTDNCGIASMTVSKENFTCDDLGVHSVTLTVIDVNGNECTCVALVTVSSNVPPTAVCQNQDIYLDANGNATISANDIDNGSTANCGLSTTLALSKTDFNCTNLGPNTVTLTVTDSLGNSSTCTAIVNVFDTIPPQVTCPADIIVDATFGCSEYIVLPMPTVIEACGGIAMVVMTNPNITINLTNTGNYAGYFPVGTTEVIYKVDDGLGNWAMCTFNVTVNDITPPTIDNLPSNLTVSNDPSLCEAVVNWTAPTANDNCPGATLTATHNPGDVFPVGTTTIIYTAVDAVGNTTVDSFKITVQDTEVPTIICKATAAVPGQVLTVLDVYAGSSDNCGVDLSTLQLTVSGPIECSTVGQVAYTLTVEDIHGNIGSCSSVINVIDNTPPTAVCQDITVYLDANGTATITPNMADNGSSDDCGIGSMVLSQTLFNCSHVGTQQTTLTVTDFSGNTANCVALVYVFDTIAPTLVTQDATVYLDANGQVTITENDVIVTKYDNCQIASVDFNKDFDCSNIGANPITITVTDVNGNVTVGNATVTVSDNTNPTAVCQDATVYLDANGNATVSTSDINNGSSDNCAIATMTVYPNTFTCSNVGANTVTLTVTDVNGNSATCTSTVTVSDNTNPTAVCKNVSVMLDLNGQATITTADINNGSTDNCGIASITISESSFTCENVGANSVTLTVTDVNGNVSTCNATVTVLDMVFPTAKCKNATVYLDANGQAVVTGAEIDNGSFDNCGIASMNPIPSTFTCANIGANSVMFMVTDVNGNISVCMTTVTVVDNIAPTAVCKDATVTLDANGNATVSTSDINNGSSDNCAIATMTVYPNTFDCSNVGANTVTLTVTDVNGNVSTCTSTVTVIGGGQPEVQCKDATLYLDANGKAIVTTNDVVQSSTGGCGSALTLSVSPNTFDCAKIGQNTVTVTATDANGNSATCTATVTIKDNTAPTAICKNVTVNLDANGSATITANDINNGSSDNCGIATMTVYPNTFDCLNIGNNSVTLTVADASGNTSTCTATVTVKDVTAPVALCKNATVTLNATGQVIITANDVNGGSTDNCKIATMTVSPSTFNCSNIGANTVTLTVKDSEGNVSTCTATVTVTDNIAPTVTCKNTIVTLNANGQATITESNVVQSKADNCSTPTITISKTTFNCSNVGQNTVTITATDAAGNSSTCTASVTVIASASGTVTATPANCDGNIKICKDIPNNAVSYVVALHGTPGDVKYKSSLQNPLTLYQYPDGTARIRGEITNVLDNTKRWEVDVYLHQKMDLPTYQSTYSGTPWSQTGDPVSTWDYYIMDASKPNKMYGKGSFVNKTLNLVHNPTNYTKAFQVGDGASLYRPDYSISGWFGFSNSYSGTGDFDFDLKQCKVVENKKEICQDGTPSSANYVLVLHESNGITTKYKSNPTNPLVLTKNADGTATITGELRDVANTNKKWTVNVNLYQKMDLTTYQNLYAGTAWAQTGDPITTWAYYLMDPTQTNKLIGTGSLAGQTLNLTHQPTNLTKAFQVGTGASLYRTSPSLAGWMFFNGSKNGTGDFDFDLTNCIIQETCNGTATVALTGCSSTNYSYAWSNGATTATANNLCPGNYTVSVTSNGSNVYTGTVSVGDDRANCIDDNECVVTCPKGSITTFEYNVGSGNAISTITNHSSFPNNPYNVHTITKLTQNNVAASRGIWTRGYIIPPTTGFYDIYFSSDDYGTLWMSDDCDSSSKYVVGSVTGWTNYQEWTKYASQKTQNVYLEAGKPYYFEMMMKNGGGPGHWSMGWKIPGSTYIKVIEGKYTADYKCSDCSNPTNIAIGKPSSQSSTCYNAPASRANDGNTNGNFNSGSVSHTCYNKNPYWELNLQSVYNIDEIKIWNRTDAASYRLKNYYVFVSNVPFTSADPLVLKNDPNNWYSYQTVTAGSPTVIPVGRTGRYVCVMVYGYNYLHIAEVQVIGCGINGTILSQENTPTTYLPIKALENNVTEEVTPQYFEIEAYPNPFNDRLTLNAFVPEEEGFLDVRIMSMDGKVVFTQNQIGTTGEINQDLDIPNLPNGMYILEAKTANQVKTVKLVRVDRP